MQTKLYNLTSSKPSTVTLPKGLGEKVSPDLLAQAIRVFADRAHPGLAKSKTRAEVRCSTRKIYKQKGTGGARHGAKSAPIFVGGGTAHGPKNIKRILTLPKKMKKSALNMALSTKASRGEIVMVDGLAGIKKTKQAAGLLGKILADNKGSKRATLVFAKESGASKMFFRNVSEVTMVDWQDINAHGIFYGGLIVLDLVIFKSEKLKKVVSDTKKKVAVKKTQN
jgi:large subunit ribosomal protein L4